VSKVSVKVGDLFESDAQTLVNTVNCIGVMGKGIALEFKKRFPDMYKDYLSKCEGGQLHLGKPYLYRRLLMPWILNFPTKGHWRAVSKLSDIIKGLVYLEQNYKDWGIMSLAVPPLGCGNGQLEWTVVGPTLYRYLSKLDIPVELYAPPGTPVEELSPDFLDSQSSHTSAESTENKPIAASAVALVGVLSRISKEPYHWPIGRTAFQKVAYFVTASGVPTGLRHERGSYGPFSAEIKSLIARLENNGLVREEKRGRMFVVSPGPTYRDARERYKGDLRNWAPAIERVADLFVRLPRITDAEVAATVHFVTKEFEQSCGQVSEREVFDEIMTWKVRRHPPLDPQEVASMVRCLNVMGWVSLRPNADLPLEESAYGVLT
jgi:O-acetyl-ADP-ribose deacetylase (regulator of RNase III)